MKKSPFSFAPELYNEPKKKVSFRCMLCGLKKVEYQSVYQPVKCCGRFMEKINAK